jgi:hypothetical protein
MAFFKSKVEKEIMSKMEKEEQMEQFNSMIVELKNKRLELAKKAAEAEINGDENNYQIAESAIIDVSENLSLIEQTKTNFDIINLSNACGICMATAMNVLDRMSNSKLKLPNLRKIQKAQLRLNKYMKNMKVSQKAIGSALTRTNPANKSRSPEEIASIRPLIDSEKSKILSKMPGSSFDLAQEIANERSKII